MKRFPFLFIIFLVLACSPSEQGNSLDPVDETDNTDETDNPDPNADYQLLFIGNSLTIQNNLPQLVRERAAQLGISVGFTNHSGPGFGLEDHWNQGIIQGLISSGFYDYVIVQQGPSSTEAGRISLIQNGGLIADLCATGNSQLVFFMVWPSIDNFNTFSGVIANYSQAAQQNNAILCPVGSHWKAYIENTDDYSYYGSDGFHPSILGSQITAQIIVQTLGL